MKRGIFIILVCNVGGWSRQRANSGILIVLIILVQTKSMAVSELALAEFRRSDSEFLTLGEAPDCVLEPFARHFGSWASLQRLSALLVQMTCPVQPCYT